MAKIEYTPLIDFERSLTFFYRKKNYFLKDSFPNLLKVIK